MKNQNEDFIKTPTAIVIIILCVIVIFLGISKMDAKDKADQHQDYCEMVNDGHWPNYKNIECLAGE